MDYPDPPSDSEYLGQNPTDEILYPDIDETIQYPWQGSQQTTADDSFDTSVLDPRLYRDLFPSTSQYAGQQALEDDYNVEEFQDADDSEEDSSYELSEDESSE